MKRIAILGSTGSIGRNALRVVDAMPGRFRVVGLAAHSNGELLFRQALRYKPAMVSLFEPAASEGLQGRPHGCRRLPSGVEGLVEMACHPDVDLVLTSLVGGVGFAPLLAALRAGKTVALANKEPMVMAGAQFMREAKRWGARIIPVDSEPSAVFQCLNGSPGGSVRRVLLTASGGAFYGRRGSLDRVRVAEALRHPTWKMGRKITIDSATLMNKGFETIEIMHLFGLGHKAIEIVIHPQSIVHSAVEFSDGSVLAQMAPPDMRLPIQYALAYPERAAAIVKRLDLAAAGGLTFSRPDFRRFPCLALALEAAAAGGGMPAVLNAADEVAVDAFTAGRIRFTQLARVVERTMRSFRGGRGLPGFSEVVEIDQWARSKAQEACTRL
ncbi:MAG: 1-deoxy-D-xylulose-5-phosphate reductoisomerase [Elusimicrobia bacterium]|nr:1-deoxy-D-xylulose-5-phosphate reductoisomerase [Elusimicrobiota bacterium]